MHGRLAGREQPGLAVCLWMPPGMLGTWPAWAKLVWEAGQRGLAGRTVKPGCAGSCPGFAPRAGYRRVRVAEPEQLQAGVDAALASLLAAMEAREAGEKSFTQRREGAKGEKEEGRAA